MPERKPPAARFHEFDSDAILTYLTTRQHLRPHARISEILDQTTEAFGCCPAAIARALEWLGIEGDTSIGRLRRSELVQLACAVHRYWMQNAGSLTGVAGRL